jgi:hypothetical protein
MAGGGAQASSTPTYLGKDHSLILHGAVAESSAYPDWASATPNVLGYIKDKGLTDVGGNPYEGVSAYDPDADYAGPAERISDLADSLDELDSWSDHVDVAVTKAATIVPEIDVGGIFETVITEAISQAAVAIASAVMDALSDSSSMIQAATTNGRDNSLEANSFESSALVVAGTEVDDATVRGKAFATTEEASAEDASESAVTSLMTEHVVVDAASDGMLSESQIIGETMADSLSLGAKSKIAGLASEAELSMLSMAESLFSRASTSALAITSNISPEAIGNAKDLLTAAETSINPANIIYDATFLAKMSASDCISMAVSSAASATSEVVIAEMVAAFRTEDERTHLRRMGGYAAGMSDINAVNSSAFAWGMAMMESDHSANVSKFQAELRTRLYSDAFAQFLALVPVNINSYMQVYNSQMNLLGQGYSQGGQVVASMVGTFVSSYVQSFSEYMAAYVRERSDGSSLVQLAASTKKDMAISFAGLQAGVFGQTLQSRVESLRTIGALEEGSISRSVENRTKLYMEAFEKRIEATIQALASRLDFSKGAFQSYFDGAVRADLDERAQSVAYISNATAQSISKSMGDIEMNRAVTSLMLEAARMRSVAKSEEYKENLELDVNSEHWDLELFQIAGNVMSSASGAAYMRTGKPTHIQSALGGALSAASIAASIPGVGPVAMGGAALVGGIAGALSV